MTVLQKIMDRVEDSIAMVSNHPLPTNISPARTLRSSNNQKSPSVPPVAPPPSTAKPASSSMQSKPLVEKTAFSVMGKQVATININPSENYKVHQGLLDYVASEKWIEGKIIWAGASSDTKSRVKRVIARVLAFGRMEKGTCTSTLVEQLLQKVPERDSSDYQAYKQLRDAAASGLEAAYAGSLWNQFLNCSTASEISKKGNKKPTNTISALDTFAQQNSKKETELRTGKRRYVEQGDGKRIVELVEDSGAPHGTSSKKRKREEADLDEGE